MKSMDKEGSPSAKSRASLHSAPAVKQSQRAQVAPSASAASTDEPAKGLDLFIIEKVAGRTADDVDAYLNDIIGQAAVKNLRSVQWAERVQGLEEVKSRLLASRNGAVPEQVSVFKASVTVLVRLLQVERRRLHCAPVSSIVQPNALCAHHAVCPPEPTTRRRTGWCLSTCPLLSSSLC